MFLDTFQNLSSGILESTFYHSYIIVLCSISSNTAMGGGLITFQLVPLDIASIMSISIFVLATVIVKLYR